MTAVFLLKDDADALQLTILFGTVHLPAMKEAMCATSHASDSFALCIRCSISRCAFWCVLPMYMVSGERLGSQKRGQQRDMKWKRKERGNI